MKHLKFLLLITTVLLQPAAGFALPQITLPKPETTLTRVQPQTLKVYDFNALYGKIEHHPSKFYGATVEELGALSNYINEEDPYYMEINDYLRQFPNPYDWYSISPEDAKDIVGHLDTLFTKVPYIPHDIVLFRGINLKYRNGQPFEPGQEMTDKAFLSTSPSLAIAKNFAGDINNTKSVRKAVLVIYPNAPEVKGIPGNINEDEIILPRGSRMRVMARRQVTANYDVYLMQLCAKPCQAQASPAALNFWQSFSIK